LTAHDTLARRQHDELLARMATMRVALEAALSTGAIQPLFATPGGPAADPSGSATDDTCPTLRPVGRPALDVDGVFELVRCVARRSIDNMAAAGEDTRAAERGFAEGEARWQQEPPAYLQAVDSYSRAVQSLLSGPAGNGHGHP
jgi:hypothetical protein